VYRPARIVAVCVLALSASGARAGAQGIPDRLADSTFWRLITEFSEPNGVFQSDNFVSNENEWQWVIPGALTRIKPGGVYLGVGPEQNFTYIAAFAPRIAFICDIRRQNLIEHLMYKALLEMSADRAELLSRLWSRPRPPGLDSSSAPPDLVTAFAQTAVDSALQAQTLASIFQRLVTQHKFALSAEDSGSMRTVFASFASAGPDISYSVGGAMYRLITSGDTSWKFVSFPAYARSSGYVSFASLMQETDGLGANRGWLGTEDAFRRVKEFEVRNLLVPIVGDFGGPKALRAVGEFLRARDARVSVFYVSNVEQYLFQSESWAKFYTNVATLPTDSSSIFIRSFASSYRVAAHNPGSRMAQTTSGIDDIVRAFREQRLRTYFELAELRHR
jgi:hypothetical protein